MSGPLVDNSNVLASGRDGGLVDVGGKTKRDRSTRTDRLVSPLVARVYLETALDSGEFELAADNVSWSNIHRGLDGEDNKAAITATLDAEKLTVGGDIGNEHFMQLLRRINPDLRVRIAIPDGFNDPIILFQGYPQTQKPSWSPNHQSVAFDCLSEGQDRLRFGVGVHVAGRFMRQTPGVDPSTWDAPDLIEVSALAAVFNPGGKANCLNQGLPLPLSGEGDVTMFAFSDDDFGGAITWSYVNAIRYVAYHYARASGVNVSDLFADTDTMVNTEVNSNAVDPFVRRMLANVDGVSIQSLNAEEALVALCSAAGLHLEVVTDTKGGRAGFAVRIYARLSDKDEATASAVRFMVTPVVRDIARDAPFTDYSGVSDEDIARRNAARQASITIDHRTRNRITVLAGPQDFEVTLLLRPGWKPYDNLDNLQTVGSEGAQEPDADAIAENIAKAIKFWEDEFVDAGQERMDPETGLPLSQFHRLHPDHHQVADVGRLWIFPDTDDFVGSDTDEEGMTTMTSDWKRDDGPWADAELYSPVTEQGNLIYVDSALGGGLTNEITKDWVQRARPFGDILRRFRDADTNRTPIVRFNYVATDPKKALADFIAPRAEPDWVEYKGNALFDKTYAALLLPDPNLILSSHLRPRPDADNGTMLHAYIAGHFFVSVTCTVRGDQRVSMAVQGFGATARRRHGLVDAGREQFVVRNVTIGNSHLKRILDAIGDEAFVDRNDSGLLSSFAGRMADDAARSVTAGSYSVPGIDTGVRLGDSFSGVAGLGIVLANFPEVVSITYVNTAAGGTRTIYQLTDFRDRPEVGAE